MASNQAEKPPTAEPLTSADRRLCAAELYAQGRTIPAIAQELRCSPTTVRHWRRAAEHTTTPWHELREAARRRNPANVMKALQDQLADLIHKGPGGDELQQEPGLYETRVLRMTQAVSRYRSSSAELTLQLLAINRLADWATAARNCTKAEIKVLHDVVERYCAQLKESAETLLA